MSGLAVDDEKEREASRVPGRWKAALEADDCTVAGQYAAAVRLVCSMLREEEREGSDWFGRGTGVRPNNIASLKANGQVTMKALLDSAE